MKIAAVVSLLLISGCSNAIEETRLVCNYKADGLQIVNIKHSDHVEENGSFEFIFEGRKVVNIIERTGLKNLDYKKIGSTFETRYNRITNRSFVIVMHNNFVQTYTIYHTDDVVIYSWSSMTQHGETLNTLMGAQCS